MVAKGLYRCKWATKKADTVSTFMLFGLKRERKKWGKGRGWLLIIERMLWVGLIPGHWGLTQAGAGSD